MVTQSNKPVCVVVGVGPGNGAAFARRFASQGYQVALVARSTDVTRALATTLDGARAYACDVTDAAAVGRVFGAIRTELGEVEVLVYNPGVGVWANVEDITPQDFEASWRTNVLGALLASKQVIPAMKKNRRGSIVFIGATASRRGGARTAAFAPAKAAQKSLAESMARHLWPAGIHVALVVLDGVVDTPATRRLWLLGRARHTRCCRTSRTATSSNRTTLPRMFLCSRNRSHRPGRSRSRRVPSARRGRDLECGSLLPL